VSRPLREFADLWEKIRAGRRLDRRDGLRILTSPNVLETGWMADQVKRRRHGQRVYYTNSINVNYTNVCVSGCRFCAFSRPQGHDEGYLLSPEQIGIAAAEAAGRGIWEVHIVGGLHPDLGMTYYERMLREIRVRAPRILIQAFTAVELDFAAAREGLRVEEVIERLKAAGLGGIPGGGAEIFSEEIRRRICEKKISGRRWLRVHAAAHRLGVASNATMLYGLGESPEDRVEHLLMLRDQQDETGGFLAFVPLAFQTENNALGGAGTSGLDDMRVLTAARLVLDNFPHLRQLWNYVDRKFLEASLNFGVDDLGGTNFDERIARQAGSRSQGFSREDLAGIIRRLGREPVQTNSVYAEDPALGAAAPREA